MYYFRFLKKQFQKADVDNSKLLNLEEVKGLCEMLSIIITDKELKNAFDKANTKKDRSSKESDQEVLNEDEFVEFYYMLMRRPEIDDLFDRYAREDKVTKLFLVNNHVWIDTI